MSFKMVMSQIIQVDDDDEDDNTRNILMLKGRFPNSNRCDYQTKS